MLSLLLLIPVAPPPLQSSGLMGPSAEEPVQYPVPRYACNADVILQGGDFVCDTCSSMDTTTYGAGRPLLFGPHRGAAIADGADLIWDAGTPSGGDQPLDDLLVGSTGGAWLKASSEEWDRGHTGTVALFSAETIDGIPGASSTQCFEDGAAHTKLLSEQFGDLFGFAVSAVGDLDGDLVEDFMVGAPRGPFPEQPTGMGLDAPWEGRVYLYLSSERANWGPPDWAAGSGGCTGTCQTCTDGQGQPAASPTPFNCDYPGFYSAIDRASAVLVPPGASLGLAEAEYFGFSIARVGDLDGDGWADIAIGAPHSDNRTGSPFSFATDPGRCYLVSGQKLSNAVAANDGTQEVLEIGNTTYNSDGTVNQSVGDELLLGTLFPADCSFDAPIGARMGHAVEGGVDLNGDGRDDVAIGAPQYRWVRRENGIRGYSGTAVSGPVTSLPTPGNVTGAGFVRLIGGWVGSDQGTLNMATMEGQWWLPISTYETGGQTAPAGSPDYGEAFGFSLSTRVREATYPSGGAQVDLVVGAPLFSETPADSVVFTFPGDGDFWFPDWGNPGPPDFEDLMDRSFGRATAWAVPEATAMTPPASALWHYQGSEVTEMVGWEVKLLGDMNGSGGQEIAICARNFSMNQRDASSVCTDPCFQESAIDRAVLCAAGGPACDLPDCDDPTTTQVEICEADTGAGGNSCGAVTIHLGGTGLIVAEYRGEDGKDSLGWAIARITGQTVGGDKRFVLGAGRWARDGTIGTEENGRAYVIEGATTLGALQ